MTSYPTVRAYVASKKLRFHIDGTNLLTRSPYLKRYPYVFNPSISEKDLLPAGQEILQKIRGYRAKSRDIHSISIGPKNIVVRFVVRCGNPHGTKENVTRAILRALKRFEIIEVPVSA